MSKKSSIIIIIIAIIVIVTVVREPLRLLSEEEQKTPSEDKTNDKVENVCVCVCLPTQVLTAVAQNPICLANLSPTIKINEAIYIG